MESIHIFFSMALIALVGQSATAQWGGPVFESPNVHPDNTVTFSYLAPGADSVSLSGQFQSENVPLTQDTAGVWSVTVGPVEPDMYPYNFIVDEVRVADPKNTNIFPNEGFQSSILEVTGDEPLVHTLTDVPHGTVSYHHYSSPELGERPSGYLHPTGLRGKSG